MMRPVFSFLVKALDWVCIVLIWILGLIVTFQVLNRSVLHIPMPWTEEAARYCFVWMSLVGAVRVARERKFMKVDIAYMLFPAFLKKCCNVIAQIMILVVAFELLRASFILLPTTMTRLAPALQISMFWMYFAIPLSMVFVFIYSLRNLYEIVTGQNVQEDSAPE